MNEHREPLQIGSEAPAAAGRSWRHLDRRRVAWLALAGVGILVAIGLAWSWASQRAWSFLADRPEYQLPFDQITLDPDPPGWIKLSRPGLLERVRSEGKYERTLPLLKLDLGDLRTAFKRCPWVADVPRVHAGFRKLTVRLTYRKPVAEFPLERVKVDRDGVALPDEDIAVVDNYRDGLIREVDRPLIQLRDFRRLGQPVPGLTIKRIDDQPDLQVVGAARLADFLFDPKAADKPPARFVAIQPNPVPAEPLTYYATDADGNLFYWQHAPGGEAPDELKAEDKWRMLVEHVKLRGPLNARGPAFVIFQHAGLKVRPLAEAPRLKPSKR